MKKTSKSVVAIVLAIALVFSVTGAGAYAIATILGSDNTVKTLNDGSTVISVNSVDEAIELMQESPELFAGETETEVATTYKTERDATIYPTIILPGISQSVSYLADENGDPVINGDGDELSGGLLIIDSSTIVTTLISDLLVPLTSSLITQKDAGLSEAVYKTVQDVFQIQASDKNGNAINNLQTIEYSKDGYILSVAEMEQDDRDYFYRMIPMQSIKDDVGENNLYLYAFPLIANPMDSAAKLDEYIQKVKEQRGVDKVNIVTISLGGTILTSYLEYKTERNDAGEVTSYDYSDVNRVINVVSCLHGTDIMGDFFMRNFKLDDEFFFHEYVPMILEESEGYETLGHVINIALKIFPREVVEHILTAAVDGILDTLMLNCPQFWAMIPTDRFDDVLTKYDYIDQTSENADPEYAVLYEKIMAFHSAAVNLDDNLKRLNEENGVLVHNLCGYNLTYACYDYNFFGVMASTDTTNSDGIIDIDSTSLGATYARAGEVLADDYVPAAEGYISDDGSIDASTCLFPNNVWFFNGQHHEVGRNDVVIKLVGQLVTGEIKSTADKADKFPQYNGNRNTKNIFRWYIPEAEKVFTEYEADNTLYKAEDIAELHEAYDEAVALLASTICEPNAASATTERILNALRRVGKEKEEEDQTTNKALEAFTKFLDDTIYEVFGANGFSDTFETGVFPNK